MMEDPDTTRAWAAGPDGDAAFACDTSGARWPCAAPHPSGAGDGAEDGQIRAVTRALIVLEAINRLQKPNMISIARDVGLHYSTVYRLTQSLVNSGFVGYSSATRVYWPAPRCQLLSSGFGEAERLRTLATPLLKQWTRRHNWPVAVLTRRNELMTIAASTDEITSQTFVDYAPGDNFPILETASGRAYLAFCDADERETLLAKLADGQECDWLWSELNQVRTNGYATRARVLCNLTPGKTSALSVPLFGETRLLGVVTLTYFERAMRTQDAVDVFLGSIIDLASAISTSRRG